MALKRTAKIGGGITYYRGVRESYSRPTVSNVATHVGRGAFGGAAEKHPNGESYLAPKPKKQTKPASSVKQQVRKKAGTAAYRKATNSSPASPKAQYAQALYDVSKKMSEAEKKKLYQQVTASRRKKR